MLHVHATVWNGMMNNHIYSSCNSCSLTLSKCMSVLLFLLHKQWPLAWLIAQVSCDEDVVVYPCTLSRQSSALIASLRQSRREQDTPQLMPCDLTEDTPPSCSEARPMTLRVRIGKKTHRITVQMVRPSLCMSVSAKLFYSTRIHCNTEWYKDWAFAIEIYPYTRPISLVLLKQYYPLVLAWICGNVHNILILFRLSHSWTLLSV